jgi:hypothetical protein
MDDLFGHNEHVGSKSARASPSPHHQENAVFRFFARNFEIFVGVGHILNTSVRPQLTTRFMSGALSIKGNAWRDLSPGSITMPNGFSSLTTIGPQCMSSQLSEGLSWPDDE